MIQDIAPKVLHNEYMPQLPEENGRIAVFSKNRLLVKENEGRIRFLTLREWENIRPGPPADEKGSYRYLFRIDEEAYFLYADFELPKDRAAAAEHGCRFLELAKIRYQADRELSFAAYTAYHLYQWYRCSRFCGCCGTRMEPDDRERMMYCPECGNQVYPKIAPAVIAAVTDGDRILLSTYANREYKRYALIAGFAEIGETLEQTVRREVMEEVGLRVKNLRYYKTQPWGIDGNLLIGYFAQLDGSDVIRLDPNELAAAKWVHREELKDMDDGFSLTREMMRVFYEGGW